MYNYVMMIDKGSKMTKFDKTMFNYSGGYLMYTGDYEGRPVYENNPAYHPSRIGTAKDLFIARFKHRGPVSKAEFLKELLKNYTVEEYVAAMEKSSPLTILKDRNPTWYETCVEKFKSKFA
jgi:hypothetical protein